MARFLAVVGGIYTSRTHTPPGHSPPCHTPYPTACWGTYPLWTDRHLCRLIQVPLGVYRVFQTFFWPAEFPWYHQCQQESQ